MLFLLQREVLVAGQTSAHQGEHSDVANHTTMSMDDERGYLPELMGGFRGAVHILIDKNQSPDRVSAGQGFVLSGRPDSNRRPLDPQ
jgi:hypothetical protein